ncbi:MAG: M1 family aminopeptidase [Pseudomonadota bacterium]
MTDRRGPRITSVATIALGLLLRAGGICADPYPVAPEVDVQHYRFAIDLSDDTDRIQVYARLDLELATPGPAQVQLDLIQKSAQRENRGMTLRAVSSERQALSYTHHADRITIELPPELRAQRRVRIDLHYDGVPETGLIIGPNKHGDRTFFSDNWPNKARHWLATVDHIADKATAEFIVTAPSRLQVVSNGTRLEQSVLEGGLTRTHWRQSVPISPWLYVLGAAEFAIQQVDQFQGKPIETWVYWQDRDAGFHDFAEPTKDALAFFSSYVGPFEYEKLANIQSNSVGGGMEAASAILYGDDSVSGANPRSRRWQTVIVHELAHQWFGNSVTESSWDDVWLSEGFATYFSFLFFEHAQGKAEFDRHLIDARTRALAFSDEQPDYRVQHANLQDMAKVTTRQIYDKGAWILHMLRHQIGDRAWWSGVRSYYRRHRNAIAQTSDFRRAMERACECELGQFFDYWLRSGSTVKLDARWHYDASTGRLQIDVTRRGHSTGAPPMTLEAAVYPESSPLPTLVAIPLDNEGGAATLDMEERPVRILLDPHTRILASWELSETAPGTRGGATKTTIRAQP